MRFDETYRINTNDADMNGVVSVSAVMRIMQDTASLAMEADKPSYDELFDSGYSFILSRFFVRISEPLYPHDTVVSETWASDGAGASCERYYRIERDGITVAEAASMWAIVDINKKKLVRPSSLDLHYRTDAPLGIAPMLRFCMPQGEYAMLGTRRIAYEDIDRNMHMNNTHYPDMLCGFIPMEKRRVSEFAVNYRSEAPLGELITVTAAEADGEHFIRTMKEDGTVNVDCRIRTVSI